MSASNDRIYGSLQSRPSPKTSDMIDGDFTFLELFLGWHSTQDGWCFV
jgi:hypothetical protein